MTLTQRAEINAGKSPEQATAIAYSAQNRADSTNTAQSGVLVKVKELAEKFGK